MPENEKDPPRPEIVIQHQPTNVPGGNGIFHPKGTVIQLPNGPKYRLTDIGWKLIVDKSDEEPV